MTKIPIRHVPLDVNEEWRLNEKRLEAENAIQNRLSLLQRIVKVVENPSFEVPTTDYVSLLQQFATLLRNLEGKEALSDEVFEDPGQKADSLGNVLMIHKKRSARDSRILNLLGKEIAILCNNHLKAFRQQVGAEYLWSQLDLDPALDIGSEEILASKQQIQYLKRENSRLDRRNESLYLENDRLRRQLARLQPVPAGQRHLSTVERDHVPHTFGAGFANLEYVGIYRDSYPHLHKGLFRPFCEDKPGTSKLEALPGDDCSRGLTTLDRKTKIKSILEDTEEPSVEKKTTNPVHFTCTEEDGKLNSMPRKQGTSEHSNSTQIGFSFE